MTHDTWAQPEDSGTSRRRTWLAAGFVLLILAALYVAAGFYFGDRVPSDTRVGGVQVGGMTQTQARQALADGLADEAAEPVVVSVGKTTRSIDPAEAGLTHDYGASLEGLTGFSLNPVTLWAHVAGGVDRDVEVDVDESRLAKAVDTATKGLDKKPVEGTVKIEDGAVRTTASKPGLSIKRDELTAAIADGWPREHRFEAPTSTPEPKLTQAEIDAFVKDDLEPLIAAPVTVKSTDPEAESGAGDISFTVDPEELAGAVTVTSGKDALSVDVDAAKAAEVTLAAAEASGNFRPAQDAIVTRVGSGFEVAPSTTGLALKKDGLGAKVVDAMGKKGAERVVTAETVATQPDLTTKEAERTLPKEVISTFTTYLPDNPVRTNNIRIAARDLNGAYVAPGETFSLNQRLGQRTPAKGYQEAGVIYNGRLREDYGGGISQLSTTLFNAIFFSGARIEEFHPHSFYISRYPEGREATISWPNVDNRFTNDTGAGILISAAVNGNEVTVTFHGRKKYDEVKASKSPRRNIVQPKKIKDDGKDCVPQSPTPGFTVDITRTFIKGGRTVNSSSFTTRYDPADHIVCTG